MAGLVSKIPKTRSADAAPTCISENTLLNDRTGCKAENIIKIKRIKSSDVSPWAFNTSLPPIHKRAMPIITPNVSVIGGARLRSRALRNIKW